MPVHRAGMLKSPVDRNPPRPPRFEPQLFGPRGVPTVIENIKVLSGENVPVALEKRFPQMLGQRLKGATVLRVLRVNRIIVEPRADEVVIPRVVEIRALESRGRLMIDPQRLHPGVADVSRVRRARHARAASA